MNRLALDGGCKQLLLAQEEECTTPMYINSIRCSTYVPHFSEISSGVLRDILSSPPDTHFSHEYKHAYEERGTFKLLDLLFVKHDICVYNT